MSDALCLIPLTPPVHYKMSPLLSFPPTGTRRGGQGRWRRWGCSTSSLSLASWSSWGSFWTWCRSPWGYQHTPRLPEDKITSYKWCCRYLRLIQSSRLFAHSDIKRSGWLTHTDGGLTWSLGTSLVTCLQFLWGSIWHSSSGLSLITVFTTSWHTSGPWWQKTTVKNMRIKSMFFVRWPPWIRIPWGRRARWAPCYSRSWWCTWWSASSPWCTAVSATSDTAWWWCSPQWRPRTSRPLPSRSWPHHPRPKFARLQLNCHKKLSGDGRLEIFSCVWLRCQIEIN